jgi:hypothetical protein
MRCEKARSRLSGATTSGSFQLIIAPRCQVLCISSLLSQQSEAASSTGAFLQFLFRAVSVSDASGRRCSAKAAPGRLCSLLVAGSDNRLAWSSASAKVGVHLGQNTTCSGPGTCVGILSPRSQHLPDMAALAYQHRYQTGTAIKLVVSTATAEASC